MVIKSKAIRRRRKAGEVGREGGRHWYQLRREVKGRAQLRWEGSLFYLGSRPSPAGRTETAI